MRLWSLHPRYLDTKGLVAVWREALLAKAVLAGKTKGYTKHSQLHRFKQHESPVEAINCYLGGIYDEALERGYSFDGSKLEHSLVQQLTVTQGQISFELNHLLEKLKTRSPLTYSLLLGVEVVEPHPLFMIIPGPVESWEKV